MDDLLRALGHELRLRLLRTILAEPGLKHSELLRLLGLSTAAKGTLTKALDPLEDAGLIRRRDGGYIPTDPSATLDALEAIAQLDIVAKSELAARAAAAAARASALAAELREAAERQKRPRLREAGRS